MSKQSFPMRLRELAEAAPDAPAITRGDVTMSRRDLDLASNRRARFYADLGVRLGDLVTIAAAKDFDFYISVIALWKVGATPQPVSPRLPLREIRAIVEKVGPPLVIGFDQDMLPGQRVVASNAEDGHCSSDPLPDVVAPSFRATTSGGSTGIPKVVYFKFPCMWDTDQILFDIGHDQTQLVAGPNFQGAPYTFAIFGLLNGHHLIVMDRFDAEEALRLIDRHRVSWLFLVPTMMQRMLEIHPKLETKYSLDSIETMLHSASHCPDWLKRAWIDWIGPDKIIEIYGGSEGIGTTRITGREWLDRPGSVGRPVPGSQLAVFNARGERTLPGEIGEIAWLPDGGPGSTYRYIGTPAAQREGGWESFGDMGWLDEDGFLYLADRRTDMIVTGGNNVYPAEIEGVLNEHPAVRSCAVIGLPKGDLGNIVHAIVETAEPLMDTDLLDFLADRLVKYKWPRSFEFVDYPLRDDAGKTRRVALRDERIEKFGLKRNDTSHGATTS